MLKLSIVFLLGLSTTIAFGQGKFIPDEKYLNQSAKAFSLYGEKRYIQAARSYDTLFNTNSGLGLQSDCYNAATVWALSGNADKAFFYLKTAITAGKWMNLSRILSDPDLQTLHVDKRWQQLIDAAKSRSKKAATRFNKPLVGLLDTVLKADQTDRINIAVVQKQYGPGSPQMDSLRRKIHLQDSVNKIQVMQIIDRYGWPGPETVGEPGAKTIFLVIQHSDLRTQVNYLPKMKEAVEKDRACPEDLALLEDRILIGQGKKQIYGSQLHQDNITGKNEFWPIDDEAHVNERRASVGLIPLEKYAKYFGIEYTVPK
ncbi:MAG: hypothetical protein J7539_03675 [Niabella sp.]|nr:hypothetical protein [Niabella sp.]